MRCVQSFCSTIMPRFFKQTKWKAFQRQCHLWGFKRIAEGPDTGAYFHPNFIRGQPNLCQFMVRQKIKVGEPDAVVNRKEGRSSFKQQDPLPRNQGVFNSRELNDIPQNTSDNAALLMLLQQRLQQQQCIQHHQDQRRQQGQEQQLGSGFSSAGAHGSAGLSHENLQEQEMLQQQMQLRVQQQMQQQPQTQQQNRLSATIFKNTKGADVNFNNLSSGLNFMGSLPPELPGASMPNSIPMPMPVNFFAPTPTPTRSQSVPFPWKLHDMLTKMSQQGYDHIVSWNPAGTALKIRDTKRFAEQIMPQHFRQTKYKSFQRQLNLWGFQRISKGPDKGSYFNPHFLRSDKSLCRNMTHTSVKGTSLRSPVSTGPSAKKEEEYVFNSPQEFINAILDEKIRQDVQALHELILRVAPQLPTGDRIHKNILEYGKYSHQYKTGKVGEWCKIGISYGKQITLHCSGLVNNKYVIGHFSDRFPRAKAGITSLRFTRVSDLDPIALENLIRVTAAAEPEPSAAFERQVTSFHYMSAQAA